MIFEEYNEQKAMRAAKEHAEKRFNEGVEKGIEKGVSKEKKQSVLRYSQLGLSAEQIAKGSDLPIEEVKKVIKTYEQSLKETPYTPFIKVPYKVDMRKLSNYLRQKGCSFDELTDAEKAKFVDGDLSEFREYLKKHNLHNSF